jgi:hypothetical protein
MGPTRFPETSVNNYHTTPRNNIPEERRSHQHGGGSLKSQIHFYIIYQATKSKKCLNSHIQQFPEFHPQRKDN